MKNLKNKMSKQTKVKTIKINFKNKNKNKIFKRKKTLIANTSISQTIIAHQTDKKNNFNQMYIDIKSKYDHM